LNLNITKNSYNWDSWKYQISNTLDIKIIWNSKNWKSNIILKDLNKNIEILKSNISLNNKILNWNTNIKDFNWNNIISIIHDWKIDKTNLELNNKFNLNTKLISQINLPTSKSRDSIRITDLKSLQAAIELYYMDNWKYPTTIKNNELIKPYIYKIPQDPLKNFLWTNWCKFWYIYQVWDKNWIKNQVYKLSACLENTDKTKNDWWTDNNKFEIWIWINNDKNYYKKFYINWYKTWNKK